ncbi:BA14K family protein [Roseibium aggregatum]|uniref:Lectin-like protein BA14k n=1 Tax=Roseibium aggregatum TaxID=187304 RepID=A0A926P1A6_9HYPH|nr:BA14K family protein [Roseibium aggregatum]MBD1548010.1 BA14K family protein [Roseibium aggregatum]
MLLKILNAGFAGCLAAATAFTGFAGPAQALPLPRTNPPITEDLGGNVIRVQNEIPANPKWIYPRSYKERYEPPDSYGHQGRTNRSQRVDRSQRHHRSNRGFYRHNGHTYYNGHRGYRHPRRGYRQYNGWWFPLGAFTFGTIIGPGYYYPSYPSRGLSQAHYNWCYRKYRSYRAYDNTFQPYHGPRKACRSPYWP